MRDPARIGPTLALIEVLWRRNPDMRLGQLLLNIDRDNLWNLEDEQLQHRAAVALADGFPALCKGSILVDNEGEA